MQLVRRPVQQLCICRPLLIYKHASRARESTQEKAVEKNGTLRACFFQMWKLPPTTLSPVERRRNIDLSFSPTGRSRKKIQTERIKMKNFIMLLIFAVACTLSASAGVPKGESGFLLGGNAQNAQDPENPANDVIVINTLAPPFYGTVSRVLGVQIAALDNMLEFK